MAKKTKVKNNEPLEAKLWKAADTLRKNIDAAEYKHVVLGLIFLKYISDAFEELYEELKKDPYADPEDKDEYLAKNVFYIPEKARLDKKNREITINGKVKVQNIPEFAFECRVGNYSPIEWVSKYLAKQEDKDTGIIWDPKIKVSEFIDIVKKLIAFSEKCLEIKEKLNGCYN